MRFTVLTTLLDGPFTIVSLAFIVPASVLGFMLVFDESLADHIFLSVVVGAAFGLAIGGAISSASRCTFAWTLPGFRKDALHAFAASGALLSAVIACTLFLAGTGAAAFLPALTAFAAFACGGALTLTPEGLWVQSFLWMGFVGLHMSGIAPRRWFAAAAGAALTVAIAIGALGAAFGVRTWRWAAHYPGKTWMMGTLADRLRRMPWWPRLHSPRPERLACQVRPAASPATSTARCVLALVRERSLVTQAVRMAGFFALLPAWTALAHRGGLTSSTTAALTMLLPPLGVVFMLTAPSQRGYYPWPRALRRRVAYVDQAVAALGYALVLGPISSGVLLALVSAETPSAAVARLVAASLVLLPLARLIHGTEPLRGSSDAVAASGLFGVLLVGSVAWARSVDRWLPALVPSGVGQAVVLALMIGISQVLYWRHLGKHFTMGDLV